MHHQQRKRNSHNTTNGLCSFVCWCIMQISVQTIQATCPQQMYTGCRVSQQHRNLTSDRTRVCSTAPAMLQISMEAPSALNKKCPCSTGARLCRQVKTKAICGGAKVRSYSSAAVLLCSSKYVSDSPKPACTSSGMLRQSIRLDGSAAVLL